MADAVLERRHGLGIAIEPLRQQRLVFGMHQCGPILGPRQRPGGIAKHALITFAAGQSGLVVDFVDHAAQFTRHRAEALVGRGQCGFADLAGGDVHDQPYHSPRGAGVVAVHHEGAIQRPMPGAVGVPEAILGFQHLRTGIHMPQAVAEFLDLAFRVRAQQLAPAVHVGTAKGRVHAEHPVVAVGVVGQVLRHVPVPDAGGS
jgi:hypothetical protein